MTPIIKSNRYINAIQLKAKEPFKAEQIFMAILLDMHATTQERCDAASQLFDIAIRDNNPSYAMYIWEMIMKLQNIEISDLGLYPQHRQLINSIAKKHAIKLSTIRDLQSLLAFHESEYKSRRLLLFLMTVKPFLLQDLKEAIDIALKKTSHLGDIFKNSSPIIVQT